MKGFLPLLFVGLLFEASAATNYVSVLGRIGAAGTPADPYSVIQEAVNASSAGDTVIVGPGTYSTGEDATTYSRVAITKNITLKSSHGAFVTTIAGSGTGTYGTESARRAVYLTTGVVDGFTLTAGATHGILISPTYHSRGAGVCYAGSIDNIVRIKNCLITGNMAYIGGGVFGPLGIGNCVIKDNSSFWSTASQTYYIRAINCYFSGGNSSTGYAMGGDANTNATAMNCVFATNGAIRPLTFTTISYSCTPFKDGEGMVDGGNNIIATDAKLDSSTWRPATNSPCLNVGGSTWNSTAIATQLPTDLSGNIRTNGTLDMGPVEWMIYKTTNVTATTDSPSGVTVSWAYSSPDVTYYKIYRATTNALSSATLVSTSLDTSARSYLDTTVGYKTNYYYWVQATNSVLKATGAFSTHSFSDFVVGSRLTLTNTPPVLSTGAYQVYTNTVSVSVTGTNIYYWINGGSEAYSATNFILTVTNDMFLSAQARSLDKYDSSMVTSMLYRAYQLTVNNQTNYLLAGTVTNITAREIANRPFIGWTGYTNSADRTLVLTIPPQDVVLQATYQEAVGPVGLVTISVDADQVLLEWTEVPNALLYEIQRGDSLDGPFSSLAQTDLAFHQDTTAIPGHLYYYQVRAFAVSSTDEEQAGAFSAIVSGTRPALLEVAPSGFTLPLIASASEYSLAVSANMEWAVASRAVWITVKSSSAQGIVFTVKSNQTTTNARTGTVRFILAGGVVTNDFSLTQSGNLKPNTPVGGSPSGAGIDPFNVELVASPYSDPEGDAQSNTEWRINGVPTSNPIPQLAYATNYVWQVRYKDAYSWSDWSSELSFSTLVPELSASVSATNAPKEGLTFAFTVTSNCQWTVSADVGWLTCVPSGDQVTVTVARNTNDVRTGHVYIHPIATNGWAQTVVVTQAEWPIPPTPIPLLPLNNAVVAGTVRLVLQAVEGISNTEWRVNGVTTNSFSVATKFTNSVLIQKGITNFWSARFTDGIRWSASSDTNAFFRMTSDFFYVATNGNDSADGETWGQAFRTIQRGVDSAPAGGTVLVSNGVYNTSGNGVIWGLKAVVVLTNSITLRSVAGAGQTIVQAQMNQSVGRCLYVKTNVVVEGFTLTGGKTKTTSSNSGDLWGAAVYSENGLQSVFKACIISNNIAGTGIIYQDMGGYLTFESCLFAGNSSAGLLAGRLPVNRFYNCTLVQNTGSVLLNNALLYNTLVVSNTVDTVASLSGSNNSIGAFSAAQFVNFARNDFRLLPSAVSCIDKGTTNFLPYILGQTDLSGKPRVQGRHPDIGAYETTPPPPTILRVF